MNIVQVTDIQAVQMDARTDGAKDHTAADGTSRPLREAVGGVVDGAETSSSGS